MRKQMARGFTLVELMIVVVIVGILASLAYTAYIEQVRETRRADCAAALVGLGNAMERYFTVNGTYVGATLGGATGVYPNQCPTDGGSTVYYNLTIPTLTASTFVAQAAPAGPQASDKCGNLTYRNTGVKGVTSAASGVLWDQCWK